MGIYDLFVSPVMKNTIQSLILLVCAFSLSPRAIAQTNNTISDSTVGFSVRGRYTTPGAGLDDSYWSLEAFLPLLQKPGKSVTFVQGRGLWLGESNQGWNVLLGQRFSTTDKQIWGGYVAYDTRETGSKNYQQIGVGIERLGDDWDGRINGYLPLGDSRELLSESIGNVGFFKNFFGRPVERRYRGAFAGVELEAGAPIAKLGAGDLRFYGTLLYYTNPDSDPVFGVRGRLEARPTDNTLIGVSIQQDPLFDTSVILDLGVGLSVGGNRGSKRTIAPRMGEYIARNPIITVANFTKTDFSEKAINPATGKPWQFRHVVVGAGNGNGTFEAPAGNIQTALNVAQGDDIVYVEAGTNTGISAFKIPDAVSVISTALTQEIDTVQYGRITLPGSGSGRYPTVNGTVSMGNNTTLRGFDLRNITGSGIDAANVRDITIIDNRITNVTQQGITLNGVLGNNNLVARNAITGTGNQGIFVQAFGDNQQRVILNQNSITNAGGAGIFGLTSGNAQQQINGNDNTVNVAKGAGVFFLSSGNSRQTAIMTNSSVSNITENTVVENANNDSKGGQGIFLSASGGATQNITLNNTRISDTIAQGLFAEVNGDPQNPAILSRQNLTFNQLLAQRATGQGVFVQGNGNSEQELKIDGAAISNIIKDSKGEGGQGIFVAANDGSRQKFTINNPKVSDNTAQGIFVQADNGSQQNFTINNPISNRNASQGIFIRSGKGVVQEFEVNQPTVSNITKDTTGLGGQGIFIATGQGGKQTFRVTDANVSDTAGQGIFVAVNDDPDNPNIQSQQTFTLTSSIVNRVGGQGLFIQANGNIRQQFEVRNGSINTVTIDGGQGGQGLFVQANGGAQQSFIYDRTNITNTAAHGVFMQANGVATSRYTISNTNISNTGDNNVFIQANESGRMIGNYQSNLFQNPPLAPLPPLPTFNAASNSSQSQMCLALSGNSNSTSYSLQRNSGTFQVVNRDNLNSTNTGTFNFQPNISDFVNAAACP